MFIFDLIAGLFLMYIGTRWTYAMCLEVVDSYHCYKQGYRSKDYTVCVLLDLLFSITILVWGCTIITGIKWAI